MFEFRIVPFIDKPVIKVITGMRRTGKSTIMQLLINYLIESGVEKEQILFINMELLDNSFLTDIYELHKFVQEHKNMAGKRLYIQVCYIISDEKVRYKEIRPFLRLMTTILNIYLPWTQSLKAAKKEF
jgi:hypothetical protein